ncbi:hypothetical protein BCR43DRAFT_490452 [Syncephalastrum racemosum]|uniref:Uncharacterized protein n=1 Tax=Syncephalastrum racemosum TaxID=13706 RepID=A0A1X2HG03_SYNRA|nr:hypothetical protein BCR43DRAFT_490452 [Syncephalastrum racemosum]
MLFSPTRFLARFADMPAALGPSSSSAWLPLVSTPRPSAQILVYDRVLRSGRPLGVSTIRLWLSLHSCMRTT